MADVVPERSIAESLAAELIAAGVRGKRVLIARAAEARDVLPDQLQERRREVEVVALYETVREQLDMTRLEQLAGADYVTFTSSSTVRFLLEAIGGAERFPRGPARGLDRAGHERHRARARPARCTSRRSATTSTASWTRCWATRSRPWPPECCRCRSSPTTDTTMSSSACATASCSGSRRARS